MAAIEVHGLVKEFGAVRALGGIDLQVEEGTVLGLLGPNGSGKTTTVSILATLSRPDSGRATICGHDVVAESARVRELISLTGQYASLDEALTARENLAVFGRLTGLRGAAVNHRVGELAELYELDEVMGRKVAALSGGMRRRVDIACALVTRPRVLFLDEPTTGLDPRSRSAVWDTVARLRDEGITVLLTTQYLEEADRLADRIVMLDHGAVVAEGTAESLKQQAGSAICEITLNTGADLSRTRRALAALDVVEDVDGMSADSTAVAGTDPHPKLAVRAADGMASVATVIALLTEAGVDVYDIGLRRPSLDEVFMRLTGHPPTRDDADAVDAGSQVGSR